VKITKGGSNIEYVYKNKKKEYSEKRLYILWRFHAKRQLIVNLKVVERG